MAFQALLPYALAAYGGYRGYKASKDAGGSGIQRLLGCATGAFLGYQGGTMFPGVQASIGTQGGFVPFLQQPAVKSISRQLPFLSTAQPSILNPAGQSAVGASTLPIPDVNDKEPGGVMDLFNKLLRRQRLNPKTGAPTGEMEFSPGKVASAIGLTALGTGAF